MNTNIVSYIIETTSMNQTDIAERLSNLNDDKKGISQASVSKWNRGEKIPKGREQELLMIADLYWELEDKYTEDDDFMFEQESLIDSRWNIIVKSEKISLFNILELLQMIIKSPFPLISNHKPNYWKSE